VITVCRVKVEDTYPLRAKVLRNGGPPEMARVVGDDAPEVATYAARDAGGKLNFALSAATTMSAAAAQGEPDAGGGALGRR
jgi:hypothetical protein